MKKKLGYLTLRELIIIVGAVIILAMLIATPFIIKSNDEIVKSYSIEYFKKDNTVVDETCETYENGLDYITIDYDDDNKQYVVNVTNARYYVKLEDVVVIPYTKNEVHFEITKSGKCKLYFFIKWEV